jgi:L-ascorbate metabolism protein UlaG (beta-lactamase superfamily)
MTDLQLAPTPTPTATRRPDASLTFIGTATMLLRLGPFTILTDPNFVRRGDEVDLGYGMRSERRTEPAMGIGDLPALDAVLLSHLHGDHFDQVAEAQLPSDLRIVTTPQATAGLRAKGFRDVLGLRTWGRHELQRGDVRLRITAVPARHAATPVYALLPRVMGSMLDLSVGRDRILRLYITGDTLIHDRLRLIPRRFPDIDVAVLHLGGTRIAGLLLTMDARQGVECLRIVEPRVAIPVHYDDYPVFRSPLSDFLGAVDADGRGHQVRPVERGQTIDLFEPRPGLLRDR